MIAENTPESDLWEGIQAGGRQRRVVETMLYDRFSYLMPSGMRKHRLDPDECASAYSDSILALIHHLVNGCFQKRSSLKTYLYRIFTNKCIDLIRYKATQRGRLHTTQLMDDTFVDVPDTVRSVVERLTAQYDVDELQQRIRGLNAKSQAIILAWGEGYSDEEIAQMQGYRSAAVAKTSRLRCLKKLQQLYRR